MRIKNLSWKQLFKGLHPNVFFLGLVSFFTDVSSELVFTSMPLFLSNVLGVKTTFIGLIEGIADSTSTILRILSGWLSDRLARRRSLAFCGYFLSMLAKPLMYLASTWVFVLGIRFVDRLGKGIRTAPRDALLADSSPANMRGKSFGFHRAMDTGGAALGIIIAALMVFSIQRSQLMLSQSTYRWLIIAGIIPAVLSLLMFFFVRDIKPGKNDNPHNSTNKPPTKFDRRFKMLLLIMGIFTLGNSSDAFLILRAQNLGSSVFHILLMLALFNSVYSITSIPSGILSDKIGRKWLLIIGWCIYSLVYLGFASANNEIYVWILFPLYGAFYGATEGVAKAMVADIVPAEKRGTAYGLFNGITGLAVLPASIIAGWLWQTFNPTIPFYFGASLSAVAVAMLLLLIPAVEKN